jgi:hypothetical protein
MGTLLPTTGYAALDWIVYAGAVVTACVAIWRYAIKPTAKAYNKIDEYGPVLGEIAKQFKSDSGSTLRDTINRLETAAIKNMRALEASEARAIVETATLARIQVQLGVLEARLTGRVLSDVAPIAAAAEAAADKVKATAADTAAALVEVVNPDPIKVQVINPDPIDVRDISPEDQ